MNVLLLKFFTCVNHLYNTNTIVHLFSFALNNVPLVSICCICLKTSLLFFVRVNLKHTGYTSTFVQRTNFLFSLSKKMNDCKIHYCNLLIHQISNFGSCNDKYSYKNSEVIDCKILCQPQLYAGSVKGNQMEIYRKLSFYHHLVQCLFLLYIRLKLRLHRHEYQRRNIITCTVEYLICNIIIVH